MHKLALVATTAAVSVGATVGIDAAVSSAGGHHHARLARLAAHRVVHAELVVARPDGTFPTITVDRGTVTGIDGSTIHLREGTAKALYKTVDLTLPQDAIVRVNGRRASVSDLRAGMRAGVAQLPHRTLVRARG